MFGNIKDLKVILGEICNGIAVFIAHNHIQHRFTGADAENRDGLIRLGWLVLLCCREECGGKNKADGG